MSRRDINPPIAQKNKRKVKNSTPSLPLEKSIYNCSLPLIIFTVGHIVHNIEDSRENEKCGDKFFSQANCIKMPVMTLPRRYIVTISEILLVSKI